MVRFRVSDDLNDVVFLKDAKIVRFEIICSQCGRTFWRDGYQAGQCYICDRCKKANEKERIEKQKEKQKALEEKAFRKVAKTLPKVKKDMCEHFCIIPRMFSDEQIKKEACTNCPFLKLEGSTE